MGANIGTTITAQITAFNLSNYTPLVLFIGVIMYVFIKKNIIRHIGSIIMGFGMLFQGIIMMKAAIAPLSETAGFVSFMSGLTNPVIAVLFGVAFTALLQSSSSSIVIFQAFAVEGLMTYDIAIYLVIGAAIGSVTPNILASLTANRDGKRTAMTNLIFNLIRAGILIVLINVFPQITDAIQALSPGDIGRQIANTHTIFAIVAVAIEAPFANKIVDLTKKIIPVKDFEFEKQEDRELMYMKLAPNTNMAPAVALSQTHLEIIRMGRIAEKTLQYALDAFFNFDEELGRKVKEREESVDILNQKIGQTMVILKSLELTDRSVQRVSNLTIACTDIERLSDHAENIVEYLEILKGRRARLTDTARQELWNMSRDMMKTVHMAMDIFESENYSYTVELDASEKKVDEHERVLIANHIDRLMNETCDPVAGVVFTDLVTDFERCADHAINIAYSLKDKTA